MKRKYLILLLLITMLVLTLMVSACGKDKYTITWMNYDGTVLEVDEEIETGTMPSYDSATPTRSAETHYTYEFSGWDSSVQEVSGDATYTATFTKKAKSYTITFVDDSGSTAIPYTYGASITEPTPTARAGYTVTWDTYTLDGTKTVNAKYEINTYTVTWKNEDGSVLETDTNVEFGSVPSYDGATPTKDAETHYTYEFSGWDNSIATVSADIIYTATFSEKANSYSITFVDDSGSTIAPYTYGGSITEPTPTARAGYTVTWETYTLDGTKTVNAVYAINKYIISFDVDGTITTQEVSYGDVPSYGDTEPTKAGYLFDGWITKDGNPYVASSVSSEFTLYATWKVESTTPTPTTYHNVIIDNDNGDVLIYKENIAYGSFLQDETAPTKEYYSFVGYDVNGDAVADFTALSEIAVTSDMTITAIYQINQNTVTFYALDGVTILDAQLVDYSSTAIMPSNVNVVGYTYLNFAYDKENIVAFDFDTAIIEAIELYAIYDKDQGVFVVTFYNDEQGASNNTVFATVQAKENESATMQGTPTKTGYNFVEWSASYSLVTEDLYIYPIYEKLEYDVIFTYDSGVVIETQKVKYLESASLPTVVDIIGYTFSGFDCDDDGIADELYTSVTSRITAVAVYSPNSITVKFDAGSGSLTSDSTSTIEYNTAVLTPSNPILAGSLFSHWSLEGSSDAYDFNTLVTAEITLVANYTKLVDMYTVVFYDEYGEQIGNVQVVAAGYNATLPGGYGTSNGYVGWDSDGDKIADLGYQNIQTNMSIYALKENILNISNLAMNGATDSYKVTFIVNDVEYNVEYVDGGDLASIPTTPIVTGKVFEYWQLSGGAFDFDTPVTSDITLVAKLDTIQEIYAVTFVDYDGATIYTAEVCENEDATAPTNPTRYGYVFDAWQGSYNNVVADVTITATYNKASYDVIFYDQNNNIISTEQVEYMSDATAPADLTLAGYEFSGWTNYTNITKNTGVFPIFEAVQYEVKFMYENGDVISSIMVGFDSIVPYSVAPSLNNYIFVGWYNGSELFDFSTPVSGTIELIAVYTMLDYVKYEVVFYDANGEQFGGTQYVREGESAASPGKPYMAGYEFIGWSLSYDNVQSDLAIYPIFDEISYTVEFYDYNGNLISTQTLQYGESATLPTLDEVEGYTFLYWSENTTSVTKDLTVNPVYGKVQYLVSFVDSSGSYIGTPQYVYYGDSAIAPTAPTIDGYTFVGWSADFSSVVSHMVIMPVYEITTVTPTEYTITVVSGDCGTVNANMQTAQAGETITLTITYISGYELASLTITSGSTTITLNSDYTFTMPAGDVTITAVWKEITTTDPDPTPDPDDDDTTYTEKNTVVVEKTTTGTQTTLVVSINGDVEFAGMQMDIVVGGEVVSITTSTSGVVVADNGDGTVHINFASSQNVTDAITLATIVINGEDVGDIQMANVKFVYLIDGVVQNAEYHLSI